MYICDQPCKADQIINQFGYNIYVQIQSTIHEDILDWFNILISTESSIVGKKSQDSLPFPHNRNPHDDKLVQKSNAITTVTAAYYSNRHKPTVCKGPSGTDI